MKLYKKLGIVLLLVCLAGTVFAIDFKWYDEDGNFIPGPYSDGVLGFIDEVKSMIPFIEDFNPIPTRFLGAFADAAVYSGQGATMRGYGDFKILGITSGATVAVKAPKELFTFVKGVIDMGDSDEIWDLMDGLVIDNDMTLGLAANTNVQLGLNAKFLVDGLYLGLSFGYFPSVGLQKFNTDFNMFHIGASAHYQLLKGIDLKVFKWRGLSVGAGYLFQKTHLDIGYTLEGAEYSGGIYTVGDPTLSLYVDAVTHTIPIEVNTAIQLLWFLNLNAGIGADIAFGHNTVSMELSAPVSQGGTPKGTVVAGFGGTAKPTTFNPKVMAGLGFKLGPVVIDIPISYYFAKNNDRGLSTGITIGAVF